MTRRILKDQPPDGYKEWGGKRQGLCRIFTLNGNSSPDHGSTWVTKCPYGSVGTKLWVRETWSPDAVTMYPCPQAWYRATDSYLDEERGHHTCPVKHRGNWADCLECWEAKHGPFRWRPSIHMPRWASRLTLEITGIRVERLNEISEDDAKAEGCVTGIWNKDLDNPKYSHAKEFRNLWNSIHGDGAWELNPWVWVISFRNLPTESEVAA